MMEGKINGYFFIWNGTLQTSYCYHLKFSSSRHASQQQRYPGCFWM